MAKKYILRGAMKVVLDDLEQELRDSGNSVGLQACLMASYRLGLIVDADVMKVVRCKECEHFNNIRNLYDDDICEIMYYSDGSHRTVCEEDFCSYGSRARGDNP